MVIVKFVIAGSRGGSEAGVGGGKQIGNAKFLVYKTFGCVKVHFKRVNVMLPEI